MWTSDGLLVDLVVWFLGCGISFGAMMIFYEICLRVRGRSRAKRAVIKALLGGDILRLYVPQQVAYLARRSLGFLRIQLAVLGREQGQDNATLREVRGGLQMNTCPVHEHHTSILRSESTSAQQASSFFSSVEVPARTDMHIEALEVELLCGMCMGRLSARVPLLTLPCLHQFHLECIFSGVGKRVACPVCRFPADLRGRVNAMRVDGR